MWINVYQKIVSQTLNSSKNKLNVREGSSWDEYAQEARLAELTFLHHQVYDSES